MNLGKQAEVALSKGLLQHALLLYKRIPASKIKINDLLNRANVRTALNVDLELAESDLIEAESRGCSNIYVLNHNFGWLYSKQRKYKEAIERYSEALLINPNAINTLINRGSVYAHGIDANAAIADYRKVIELDHANVMAYYNLGNILKRINQFKNAIEVYEKCIELQPNHLDAINNMAGAHNSLGNLPKGLELLRDLCLNIKAPYAAYSNYLFALIHSEVHTPNNIFAEHVRIGKIIENRVKSEFVVNSNKVNKISKKKIPSWYSKCRFKKPRC